MTLEAISPTGTVAGARWSGYFLLVGAITVLRNLLTLAVPAIIVWEYVPVRQSHDLRLFFFLFGAIVSVHVTQGLLGLWRLRVLRRLADDFGAHYTAFLDVEDVPAKRSLANYNREIERIRIFIVDNGTAFLLDFPWIFLFLGVLAWFSPWLSATSLAFTLTIAALTIGKLRHQTRLDAINVRNAPAARMPLSATGLHRPFISPANLARLQRRSQAIRHESRRGIMRKDDLLRTSLRVLKSTQTVVLLGVAAYLTSMSNASIGVMMICAFLAPRISEPPEAIATSWQRIVNAIESWRRIRSWNSPHDGNAPQYHLPTKISLRVENLSIGYPRADEALLSDISFGLEPGELLAIVGGAGSGKTTLAQTLAGCLPAISGRILIGGVDRMNVSDDTLIETIGYLPQEIIFYPGTVIENVSGFSKEVDPSVVKSALECAGLGKLLADSPDMKLDGSLSLGVRKKLAIARAAYGCPHVLILDEPFAHLDDEGMSNLLELLRLHRDRGGISVIFAARTEPLPPAARVTTIERGRIGNI
jgi:ABC-type protease/lipase transport system fused ATPase/permease subunit